MYNGFPTRLTVLKHNLTNFHSVNGAQERFYTATLVYALKNACGGKMDATVESWSHSERQTVIRLHRTSYGRNFGPH